jgi:hypothetical protein
MFSFILRKETGVPTEQEAEWVPKLEKRKSLVPAGN